MRYLSLTLLSCALAAAAYFAAAFALVPTPVQAEYWVREMLVVKRSIARARAGERKLIVTSGSAALFGIDTTQLSRELGVPVLNFGLHAAMSLDRILLEAMRAATAGDAIILALEPELYCDRGPTAWQARNAIAWDQEQWRAWSLLERVQAVAALGPHALPEMAAARYDLANAPQVLRRRLETLDDASVLAKWAAAPEPSGFAYSAYHLDGLGNMRSIEGSRLRGTIRPPNERTAVCAENVRTLRAFVSRMKEKDIEVRFANPPYVADDRVPVEEIESASNWFTKDVSGIAPLLDSRKNVVFPREFFFNTDLHLNSRGRAIRTSGLARAIRADTDFRAHLHVVQTRGDHLNKP